MNKEKITRAPSGHRRGLSHPRAKLTFEQVCEMRKLHEKKGKGYGTLALIFGCGESTARDICTYRTRISA